MRLKPIIHFAGIFIVAATFLANPISAQAATWQRNTYTSDGFSVDFSGGVNVAPVPLDDKTKQTTIHATNYLQDSGSYAYIVSVWLYTGTFPLDSGVKGALDYYKCETMTSDTRPVVAGFDEARTIHGKKCSGGTFEVGALFYRRGAWFYQIVYLIPNDSDTTDGEHFLSSFHLEQ